MKDFCRLNNGCIFGVCTQSILCLLKPTFLPPSTHQCCGVIFYTCIQITPRLILKPCRAFLPQHSAQKPDRLLRRDAFLPFQLGTPATLGGYLSEKGWYQISFGADLYFLFPPSSIILLILWTSSLCFKPPIAIGNHIHLKNFTFSLRIMWAPRVGHLCLVCSVTSWPRTGPGT